MANLEEKNKAFINKIVAYRKIVTKIVNDTEMDAKRYGIHSIEFNEENIIVYVCSYNSNREEITYPVYFDYNVKG